MQLLNLYKSIIICIATQELKEQEHNNLIRGGEQVYKPYLLSLIDSRHESDNLYEDDGTIEQSQDQQRVNEVLNENKDTIQPVLQVDIGKLVLFVIERGCCTK